LCFRRRAVQRVIWHKKKSNLDEIISLEAESTKDPAVQTLTQQPLAAFSSHRNLPEPISHRGPVLFSAEALSECRFFSTSDLTDSLGNDRRKHPRIVVDASLMILAFPPGLRRACIQIYLLLFGLVSYCYIWSRPRPLYGLFARSVTLTIIEVSELPSCEKYKGAPPPADIYRGGLTTLQRVFPEPEERFRFLSSFFADHPMPPEGRETAALIRESLLAALSCNVMWAPIPAQTRQMLSDCAPLHRGVRTTYRGFNDIADEILCGAHGLRQLDPKVLAYVKERAAVDIGAFNGDSAVVLMDFAKSIHSFEPSPSNYRQLQQAMRLNERAGVRMEPIQLALSDHLGTVRFHDSANSMAQFSESGEVTVELTTLDVFWRDRSEKIGFVKCDTEGCGLSILNGARDTLVRHLPVVSFAIYHNYDEFFGIPARLEQWLENYTFQWVFGTDAAFKWHECVFLGYPREALDWPLSQ
jgi:FkbM family methyltransferase